MMLGSLMWATLLALAGASSPAWPLFPENERAILHGREGGDPTVAVVIAPLTPSHREIGDAFRRRLESRGYRIATEVVVTAADEHPSMATLQATRANIVLAVGGRATDIALREMPGAMVVSSLSSEDDATSRMTGVATEFPADRQLELLRRILPPQVKRLGVIYNVDENARTVARMRDAARERGFEIVARPVVTPSDLPQALSSLAGAADVLWGIPDEVVMTPETARSILLFSMRNRLPLIGLSGAWVKAGALLAFDRDPEDVGSQCADQVMRLLRGDALAAVPREAPRRMDYRVNGRTAELMGVKLPPEMLKGAREVIR